MKELFKKYIAKVQKNSQDQEFGKRLREVIKNRHMTLKDFCGSISLSRNAFYNYTSGRRQMRLNLFAKVTDALAMTPMEVAYLLEAYWEEEDETNG